MYCNTLEKQVKSMNKTEIKWLREEIEQLQKVIDEREKVANEPISIDINKTISQLSLIELGDLYNTYPNCYNWLLEHREETVKTYNALYAIGAEKVEVININNADE